MYKYYDILVVGIVGLFVLFFFPEPETNFLAYAGTFIAFVLVLLALFFWKRKKIKQ